MAQRIAAVMFALFALVTSAAHAATITLTEGSLILAPLPSDTTVSVFDGTADHAVTIGDYTLESPLLNPIPVADYLCPAGQICQVNRLGLAVLVVGSAVIGPGTGSLGFSLETVPTTVPEPDTFPLLAAAMVVVWLAACGGVLLRARRS